MSKTNFRIFFFQKHYIKAQKIHGQLVCPGNSSCSCSCWAKTGLDFIPAGKRNRFYWQLPEYFPSENFFFRSLSIVAFCVPILYPWTRKSQRDKNAYLLQQPRSRNVEPVTTRNIDTRQRRHDSAVRSRWMILVSRTDFLACPVFALVSIQRRKQQ